MEPGQAISEEEITKLSDEFVKKEKDPDMAPAADGGSAKAEGSQGLTGPEVGEEKSESNKKPELPKTSSVHDEITAVSKKIAAGGKVELAKVTPSRIPSSLPTELASSSIGKYTVQISSTPDEKDAQARAQDLKDKGLSAFYVPASIKGKTWYRVSVGLFDDRKGALEYRTKLMKEQNVSSAIVEKIAKQ
jgi:septal ring-binding cell division protein DamX